MNARSVAISIFSWLIMLLLMLLRPKRVELARPEDGSADSGALGLELGHGAQDTHTQSSSQGTYCNPDDGSASEECWKKDGYKNDFCQSKLRKGHSWSGCWDENVDNFKELLCKSMLAKGFFPACWDENVGNFREQFCERSFEKGVFHPKCWHEKVKLKVGNYQEEFCKKNIEKISKDHVCEDLCVNEMEKNWYQTEVVIYGYCWNKDVRGFQGKYCDKHIRTFTRDCWRINKNDFRTRYCDIKDDGRFSGHCWDWNVNNYRAAFCKDQEDQEDRWFSEECCKEIPSSCNKEYVYRHHSASKWRRDGI